MYYLKNYFNFVQAAGISQTVDVDITKKIYELVNAGVTGIQEMKRHLKIHVKNAFGGTNLPDQ